MKIRENYPFIYFFTEPNVVFVYKVEADEYVTASELFKRGEWQTYEIRNAAEFATFDHDSHIPLLGQGYFVQQDQLHFMVEKINHLIHKHRAFHVDEVIEPYAVHLTFLPSTAGALRVGLDRPKKVISFQDPFSIGPIWKLCSKIGQANRYEWLYENINFEQDDLENRFNTTLFEIADIPGHVPIYIWTADNVIEQTGVRYILQHIKDQQNEIFLINTSEQKILKGEKQSMPHSSMLQPQELRLLYQQCKKLNPLSVQERAQFQMEWESLSDTREVLRIWQEGEVISVPEDYYDSLIIKEISEMHQKQGSKEFIRAGRVVGDILFHMYEKIADVYLEYRLRHLIYNGVLELKGIPKSMRHYSVKLRG